MYEDKPVQVAVPELRIDPEQAARLVASMTAAWQAVVLAVEPVAAAFSAWIRSVADAIAAEEELETALRWASCDNRPLFNRYRRTKKKRIRKKYAKRILAWYREAGLAPPKHNDGLDAATYAARRLGTCYDAGFWGADDCTNTACPYYNADKGPMRCLAADGCPGRETEADTNGNP